MPRHQKFISSRPNPFTHRRSIKKFSQPSDTADDPTDLMTVTFFVEPPKSGSRELGGASTAAWRVAQLSVFRTQSLTLSSTWTIQQVPPSIWTISDLQDLESSTLPWCLRKASSQLRPLPSFWLPVLYGQPLCTAVLSRSSRH